MMAIPIVLGILMLVGAAASDPSAKPYETPTEIENMGMSEAAPAPAPSRLPAFIKEMK